MADHHCRVEEEHFAHSSIWTIAAWQGQMICVKQNMTENIVNSTDKHPRITSKARRQSEVPRLHHSHSALSTTKRLNRTAAGIENGQETAMLMTLDSPGGPWPAGQEP